MHTRCSVIAVCGFLDGAEPALGCVHQQGELPLFTRENWMQIGFVGELSSCSIVRTHKHSHTITHTHNHTQHTMHTTHTPNTLTVPRDEGREPWPEPAAHAGAAELAVSAERHLEHECRGACACYPFL